MFRIGTDNIYPTPAVNELTFDTHGFNTGSDFHN